MTTSTNGRAIMVQNYDLESALETLLTGGLILYPTDTVWSIGCNATNPRAVGRLRQLKRTDDALGLEILVNSIDMLRRYIVHLHPRIETLLTYHLRPLTVLYEQGRNLPNSILSEDGQVAIRLVQDEYCRELIGRLGKPLVATAADLRQGYYPDNFGAISSDVIERVDYVSRHRRSEKERSRPSVVAQLSVKDELEFLRE
ncbi:MAG: Sua5/YciO/YrdC/YwlC family protein [Lewinellaceae bacterium]|nr:Sua5/YciO/YrdC/YwlC family protein [Lewinellaceae bacterium]MCB9290533.1 Sua5/YciO/YrdC/YwlC family protein [Lewinellaceae bacterium]